MSSDGGVDVTDANRERAPIDGQILDGVAERLRSLAGILQPRLVSADTHGTVAALGVRLGLPVTRLQPGDEAAQKAALVEEFGAAGVVAIGNGANDEEMLRRAALGIAVLGPEGTATPCLLVADVGGSGHPRGPRPSHAPPAAARHLARVDEGGTQSPRLRLTGGPHARPLAWGLAALASIVTGDAPYDGIGALRHDCVVPTVRSP